MGNENFRANPGLGSSPKTPSCLETDKTPVKVRVVPAPNATEGNCFYNVHEQIRMLGGRAQLGWAARSINDKPIFSLKLIFAFPIDRGSAFDGGDRGKRRGTKGSQRCGFVTEPSSFSRIV